MGRGWGCPMLDTARSSQLQQPLHRAQLSPSARLGALGENRLQKGPKVAVGEREGGEEGGTATQ